MISINTYHKISKSAIKSGKAPIYISFYVNRQKVEVPTGISIPIESWNTDKRKVKSKEKNAADKNLIIEQKQARINDVLVRARLKNRKLTKDSFLRAYNRPDDYDTFFDFVTFYQRKLYVKTELTTLKVHRTVIAKPKLFNPNLHFDDITIEWLKADC